MPVIAVNYWHTCFSNMKQIVLSILLLFIGNIVWAQSVLDSISYRFVYDVQAKVFEKSTKKKTDEHCLDIGKNGVSHYYSFWQSRSYHVLDSILQIGGSMQDCDRVMNEQGIESSYFTYFIFKNYPRTGLQTVDYTSMELFQYQEPMGQDWELVDGDTIILNHPCQKAVCNYHGRTWTVFYATDIPISDGPWKLCGLPGLILRAYDHSDSFIFNCVGIYQNVGGDIAMMDSKRRVLKPAQVHKLIEQISNNPDEYMRAKGRYSQAYDEKGRPFDWSKIPKRAYYESYSSGDKK